MPWIEYPDPDDTIHNWLKSLYTPWRNGLVDPSIIPLESEIDWDTYWGGTNITSFVVYEELTRHINLGLGVKTIEFEGTQVIRVVYRYIGLEKPAALKNIREFITRRLHENISPLPSALTTAGIKYMYPMDSRIFKGNPQDAQQDFWILEVRVMTRVLNNIV